MDLSIVIVNYNTGAVILECLESVYKFTLGLQFEVFVVDNASKDGSPKEIQSRFPQVKFIQNSENLFFTKANNQALRQAQGRYFLILNPDTYIKENTFKTMIDFMDANPAAGACGPKFLYPDGRLQGIGHRFPTATYALFELLFINTIFPNNPVRRGRVYDDQTASAPREIDGTGGSCMMVRKAVSDKVGILDEGILMYWEETDWCLRIRQAGYKIFHIPAAIVYHHHGAATVKLELTFVEKIFRNSMLYYYRKHYGLGLYAVLAVLSFFNLKLIAFYRSLKKLAK